MKLLFFGPLPFLGLSATRSRRRAPDLPPEPFVSLK
jgi:hypothetical protein